MSLEGWRIGRYYLKSLIKSGGMGEVYLAVDTDSGQNVAFKVSKEAASTHPDLSKVEESDRLFQREAMTISTLHHPRILRLLDFDEKTIRGRTLAYIVMPYCTEGSLADWLKQRSGSPLGLDDVAHFLSQAAEALQYAHDHQVIHRDVKPSSFLIQSSRGHPSRPHLLLGDFGIAKFSTSLHTTSTVPRGTTAYIAPEHWEGHPKAATDQYSLAVMVYELLTGHRPFEHHNPLQLMRMHYAIRPESPSKHNSRVPPEIDAVILHALEKKPEDRYSSVSAFSQAFHKALQHSRGNTDNLILKPRKDILLQRKERRRQILESKRSKLLPPVNRIVSNPARAIFPPNRAFLQSTPVPRPSRVVPHPREPLPRLDIRPIRQIDPESVPPPLPRGSFRPVDPVLRPGVRSTRPLQPEPVPIQRSTRPPRQVPYPSRRPLRLVENQASSRSELVVGVVIVIVAIALLVCWLSQFVGR